MVHLTNAAKDGTNVNVCYQVKPKGVCLCVTCSLFQDALIMQPGLR